MRQIPIERFSQETFGRYVGCKRKQKGRIFIYLVFFFRKMTFILEHFIGFIFKFNLTTDCRSCPWSNSQWSDGDRTNCSSSRLSKKGRWKTTYDNHRKSSERWKMHSRNSILQNRCYTIFRENGIRG